jgi:hypothetical protein
MTAEELDAAMEAAVPVAAAPVTSTPALADVLALPTRQSGKQLYEELAALRKQAQERGRQDRRKRIAEERRKLAPHINADLRGQLERTRTPCAVLLGPTKLGKTRAIHWLRAEFGGDVIHARELGSCERRHGLGEGYPPELDRARTARVLYIDDVGAEEARDLSVIQYAIELRYRLGLPLTVTSGLTKAELQAHLGAAYVRRLREQHAPRGDGEWPVLIIDGFGGGT